MQQLALRFLQVQLPAATVLQRQAHQEAHRYRRWSRRDKA